MARSSLVDSHLPFSPAPARPNGVRVTAQSRWARVAMAGAIVSLIAGLWAALIRLGLNVPNPRTDFAEVHGPLMVLGFLGTLISLERAVARARAWAYVAPVATAAGALAVMLGVPDRIGQLLLLIGGLVLVAILVVVMRIQPALHSAVLGSGALCWCVAAAAWLWGVDVGIFVPWLAGFLVMTVTSERLELSRFVGATRAARRSFGFAALVVAVGLLVAWPWWAAGASIGLRITGVGFIAMAAWLARNDLARRTVRVPGLTRYMALALLAGYAWLAVGGTLWIVVGHLGDGPGYDAMLHSVFLGFVMSMVFAHAPVIVPSVLRVPFPYHRSLFVPLALLHASLLLRLVGGDWAGNILAWQWGGGFDEIALLLFVSMVATSVTRAKRSRAA